MNCRPWYWDLFYISITWHIVSVLHSSCILPLYFSTHWELHNFVLIQFCNIEQVPPKNNISFSCKCYCATTLTVVAVLGGSFRFCFCCFLVAKSLISELRLSSRWPYFWSKHHRHVHSRQSSQLFRADYCDGVAFPVSALGKINTRMIQYKYVVRLLAHVLLSKCASMSMWNTIDYSQDWLIDRNNIQKSEIAQWRIHPSFFPTTPHLTPINHNTN